MNLLLWTDVLCNVIMKDMYADPPPADENLSLITPETLPAIAPELEASSVSTVGQTVLEAILGLQLHRRPLPLFPICFMILGHLRSPGFWFCQHLDSSASSGALHGIWNGSSSSPLVSLLYTSNWLVERWQR